MPNLYGPHVALSKAMHACDEVSRCRRRPFLARIASLEQVQHAKNQNQRVTAALDLGTVQQISIDPARLAGGAPEKSGKRL